MVPCPLYASTVFGFEPSPSTVCLGVGAWLAQRKEPRGQALKTFVFNKVLIVFLVSYFPLCSFGVCFKVYCAWQDLLHTLHQGVSLCAIAALLTDHFESKSPGLTLNQLEQFLLQAYKHYRVWCKEKKIAASSLRFNLSRFSRESWVSMPEVTTQYKASTVKYLQYWLYDF